MTKLPPPSGQEQNLFDLKERVKCISKPLKKGVQNVLQKSDRESSLPNWSIEHNYPQEYVHETQQ